MNLIGKEWFNKWKISIKTHGITLIALIITIIVILILVAVSVRATIQSGLFGHASKATSGYSMHQAREKLGTTLGGAQAEKYTNKEYNEIEYLNKYITNNLPNSEIKGDIAIVDGWAFELDRSVPRIGQNLGKEGTYTYPTLEITKDAFSKENLTVDIHIKAQEPEHGISKIEVILDGKVVHTFTDCDNSTDEIFRTYPATKNGTYSIKVYSEIIGTGYIKVDEFPQPKIGDYVKYTPTPANNYTGITQATGGHSNQSIPQDTGLIWQILCLNPDSTIDLTSHFSTSIEVYFQGALGYNNGVYLLNDLCSSQYKNTDLGTTARSINIYDIEKHFNDEAITLRNNSNFNGLKYGLTLEFKDNNTYTPDIHKHVWYNEKVKPTINHIAEIESKNIYSTPTTNTFTKENSLLLTQTYYNMQTIRDTCPNYYHDTINAKAFDELILGSTHYWLASRYTNYDQGMKCVNFGLYSLSSNISNNNNEFVFSGNGLYHSNGAETSSGHRIRPVVSLPSNLELTLSSVNEEDIVEWEISKK